MKQTARIISTYSADVMGVCSALFELGGMTIMHDASGCNSTYTTHDEPRWYDMDSMVYISAVTEMQAIMGDDEKLLGDIEDAVRELHPKFVAIAGTPIPTMTGFDFEAVAELAEQRTGVPCMGLATTGMNTYIYGASMAFEELARRFVNDPVKIDTKANDPTNGRKPGINILGLTPLDFSINGQAEAIKKWLEDNGFEVLSTWGMGCTLEDVAKSAEADVNLVVSAAGAAAAEDMQKHYGIPYVASVPFGGVWSAKLANTLKNYADIHKSGSIYCDIAPDASADKEKPGRGSVVIIGEAVTSLALASAIECETGLNTRVLCATEPMGIELRAKDAVTPDEEDITEELDKMAEAGSDTGLAAIIADPLYRPICPAVAKFIRLPSEAFSGRLYRSEIPNLVANAAGLINDIVNI